MQVTNTLQTNSIAMVRVSVLFAHHTVWPGYRVESLWHLLLRYCFLFVGW